MKSNVIAALEPDHRGLDLITTASADTQTLEGWMKYGPTDKSLEDEDVVVFACRDQMWQQAGTASTDDQGHFALELAGDARLPLGMTDLYVTVPGDRSGVRFLGFVGADSTELVVSDVDGTLTSSENAVVKGVVFDAGISDQADAAAAYRAIAAKGLQLVYITARGNQFTTDTRTWLDNHGFPRGPMRLASAGFTIRTTSTIAFKTRVLEALPFPIIAAIGNRATDIAAYGDSGVAADRIYIKLPEFTDEVQGALDAGDAIGFDRYDDLRTQHIAAW